MKYIFLIVFAIALLFSCEHASSPKKDTYCPPPVKVWDGGGLSYQFPKYTHRQQVMSYDCGKLAFKSGGIKVLSKP